MLEPTSPAGTHEDFLIAVDETTGGKTAPHFAAVCAATIKRPLLAAMRLKALAEELCSDPYYLSIPSVRMSLMNDGFHYSADIIDVHSRVIRELQSVEFEAYIAFSEKAELDPNYAWYDQLLLAILPDRLAENHHNSRRILLEQHGVTARRLPHLKSLIDAMVQKHSIIAGRQGVEPIVAFGTKADPCLSIADYVAGAFRDYWISGRQDPGKIQVRLFNEIRSRVRVIIDVDTGARYWRNNPLP